MGRIAAAIGWVPAVVGPLFTKELLVTSRRPRYYVLRFAYAAMLGLFIALVWMAFIESARGRSAVWRIAHMPDMGRQIVSSIVCFQFGAAQLVAIVLLSTSISEEIYQRTLVPILTTPIGYWQIVLGKFLGKLLHVGFLLAVSLPLLAIVRVLGGVPWGYLLAGVCITITASMLTGSIGMFFSILCRRAYLSILAAIGVTIALYGVTALVFVILATIVSMVAGNVGLNLLLYPNPIAAMVYETVVLNDPSSVVPGFFWPIHCAAMLAATLAILKLCEVLVRRIAVRKAVGLQAAGAGRDAPPVAVLLSPPGVPLVLRPVGAGADGRPIPPPRTPQAVLQVAWQPAPPAASAPPRPRRRRLIKSRGWNLQRVIVSPIIWRELRKPLLRDKVVQIVAMCAVLFYLLYTYAILGASGALRSGDTHAFFVSMFLIVGMACTAMDSATCIAPEKQAQTWPALLCTPVSDWHILLGKAAGTLFRCLPVWLFLLGHVVVFTLLGFLHPILVLHVLLLIVWVGVFLTGMGVYFSTRNRHATTAVLMNAGMALLLWVLIPTGAGLLGEAFGDREIARGLMYANPVVQASVVTEGATMSDHGWEAPRYDWPDGGNRHWAATTLWVFATWAGYCLLGVLLAWRAKRLFRVNVFEK